MSLKLLVATTIGMLIACSFTLAQSSIYRVEGKVADTAGKPVELLTVALFAEKDSLPAASGYTDSAGHFVLNAPASGHYLLKTQGLSFAPYISAAIALDSLQPVYVFPDIVVREPEHTLDGYQIVARKPLIETKTDRIVMNADAVLASAGMTAFDLLRQAPGIQIDQNGNITLKGKPGVTVFIDDRPTYLSGSDLEQYLRSIPASAVDQVEIMSNPPAQYDAAGTGGILNIKMKKGRNKGWNAALNLSVTQGKTTRSANSLNLNYRKDKWNAFANISYNYRNDYAQLDINRAYLDASGNTATYFDQRSYMRRSGDNWGAKAGVDYYASARHTIGIVFNSQQRRGQDAINARSDLYDRYHSPDSALQSYNLQRNYLDNSGGNLYFRYQQGSRELTVDGGYQNYFNGGRQNFENTIYSADNLPKAKESINGYLPGLLDIFTGKADYSQNVLKKIKLGIGAKISYAHTDNLAVYTYIAPDRTVHPDYDKSNHFKYGEQINAAYLNLNREGKQLSLQAGLRVEQTISRGHQLGNALKPDSAFNRQYVNLFPTLYLTYKLDTAGTHQLIFNMGRRIDRPYFDDLNPFMSPIDKFTFYAGNPFLRPSISMLSELSYTFKQRLTASLSYTSIRNSIEETIEISNNVFYSRPGNIGRKEYLTLSFNGTQDIAKWLNTQVYTEVTYTHSRSDFYTGPLDTKGFFYFLNMTNQVKFNSKWNAELSVLYLSRRYDVQFVSDPFFRLNAGVQYKMSEALTWKLNVNDIFRTLIFSGRIDNLSQTRAFYKNVPDTHTVTLNFTYRLGKLTPDASKRPAPETDDGARKK